MAPFLAPVLRAIVRTALVLPLAWLVCFATPAQAAQWDAATLTVPATADGSLVTFSEQEVKSGRRLFNSSCGTCHAGGITKTNQNVGLTLETPGTANPSKQKPRHKAGALEEAERGAF